MEFENLEQLRDTWKSGNFDFPDQIEVAGIPYQFRHGSTTDFGMVVRHDAKPYVVYQSSVQRAKQARKVGLDQWIVFVWGISSNRNIIVPYDLRSLSLHGFGGSAGHRLVKEDADRIGDVVILKVQLPSGVGVLKGKVDTGAEISSLHAEPGWKIGGGQVQFVNGELSKSIIRVPVVDNQAVSSPDGGVEYRPVVQFDITINDKPVHNALFNLNDRSKMQYPVLVGQNILDKTKFVIDTRMNDVQHPEPQLEWVEDGTDVDWDALTEYLMDTKCVISEGIDSESLMNIATTLSETDLSFSDLFRAIRTQAIQQLEDLD